MCWLTVTFKHGFQLVWKQETNYPTQQFWAGRVLCISAPQLAITVWYGLPDGSSLAILQRSVHQSPSSIAVPWFGGFPSFPTPGTLFLSSRAIVLAPKLCNLFIPPAYRSVTVFSRSPIHSYFSSQALLTEDTSCDNMCSGQPTKTTLPSIIAISVVLVKFI